MKKMGLLNGLNVNKIAGVAVFLGIVSLGWSAFADDQRADKDLVLHYTFDEGKGNVATDLSGSRNDGIIRGVQHVVSPRGFALQFDGKEGQEVDCGSNPSLMMQGDMTLEIWIKTTRKDLAGKSRMLFGDDAGIAIDRNFTLYSHHRSGDLIFAHGDGRENSWSAQLDSSFLDDGRWHFLAFVSEGSACFSFIDGKRVESTGGQMSFPITKTKSESRRIGGWGHGVFKGAIDEVCLYRRALTPQEIAAHAGIKEEQLPASKELRTAQNWLLEKVPVNVTVVNLPYSEYSADIFLRNSNGIVIAKAPAVKFRRTSKVLARYEAEAEFSLPGLVPGEYVVAAEIHNREKALTETLVRKLEITNKPDWIGSQEGISDDVLPPFTPVETKRQADGCLTVSVWGRQYDFGLTPFVAQIASGGEKLLAGPIRVVGRINGQDFNLRPAAPVLKKGTPARAIVEQSYSGGAIRLVIVSTIEYDGFMKFDCSLEADGNTSLDRFAVEIPLISQRATHRYSFAAKHLTDKCISGMLNKSESSVFVPIVWLGDEARGLSWLAESDQYWNIADPKQALQIIKTNDTVTLRLNIVDTPTPLSPQAKAHYTFALQATPLKPITKTAWDYRIVAVEGYGKELEFPETKIQNTPILRYYAGLGARIYILSHQEAFAYPMPISREYGAKVKALVEATHAENLKVIPYAVSWLFSDMAPEYAVYKEQLQLAPEQKFSTQIEPPVVDTSQWCVFGCQAGPWQDLMVHRLAQALQQYNLDGVYLDTTASPFGCSNPQHGCGYVRQDGSRAKTYPVFGIRNLLKRIYTVVKKHDSDGIVDLHVYDCMNSAALAYATSYWNGEQLRNTTPFKPDALPLDRFRTEFMGWNWGVPAEVLYYMIGGFEDILSISLLHDVPVRPGKISDAVLTSKLWRMRDQYGCAKAAWHPYWKNKELVTVRPEGCYASLFTHPENGVLVLLSNLTRASQKISVDLHPDVLGLKPPFAAINALETKPVEITPEGKMTVELPSQKWMYLWVRPLPL